MLREELQLEENDGTVISCIGVYTADPTTSARVLENSLLWFSFDHDNYTYYRAVGCQQTSSGKFIVRKIYEPMTYTEDIVHVVWGGNDVYCVNDPNCRTIYSQFSSGDISMTEISPGDHPCIFVYHAAGSLDFLDEHGKSVRDGRPILPSENDPVEPPADDPEPPVKELTEEEKRLAEFDELFGNPNSWHQIALYRQYGTVYMLQVRDLFWDGFPGETSLSDAEIDKVLLHERFAKAENIRRLPIDKVDKVLTSVFGVTFDQMKENHAVKEIYGLSSGNGYILKGEPQYIENYKTVSVAEQEDGTLQVSYTVGADNTAYVVTVRPDGKGSYHVLSNLSVDSTPGENGTHFVHDGTQPLYKKKYDLSDCQIGSLYYLDIDTGRTYYICADEISMKAGEDGYIFFVKANEPTKIYMTHLTDFSKHEVIYESQDGPITVRLLHDTWSYKNPILYFVEDNKRFVVLDLVTKEEVVLMEQYEIIFAYAMTVKNGNYTVRVSALEELYVYFEGRPSAGDEKGGYLYTVKTGEVRPDYRL